MFEQIRLNINSCKHISLGFCKLKVAFNIELVIFSIQLLYPLEQVLYERQKVGLLGRYYVALYKAWEVVNGIFQTRAKELDLETDESTVMDI